MANWNAGVIASYEGAHAQVRRLRGSASGHPCVKCAGRARDWAYTNDCPAEQVNEQGQRFTADPARYVAMCRPCHRVFDGVASKRLTREQVDEIRRRHVPGRAAGHGVRTGNTRELAAEFRVTTQYVGQLTRGKWRTSA